ncbi:hypothetical protein B0H13DRAFT_1924263 [Mycena leptocephala]|nr:hypothetical protein B0H13DRAFT_1924263 [Mycena leptocephala]
MYSGSAPASELQLFSLDASTTSAVYLTTVRIPHAIWGVDISGNLLAVIGDGFSDTRCVRSFEIDFRPTCSVGVRGVFSVEVSVRLGLTSFALTGDGRFVLVGSRGVLVCEMPVTGPRTSGEEPISLCPVWTYLFTQGFPVPVQPQLAPIVTASDGSKSLFACCGGYQRCLFMSKPGQIRSYMVTEKCVLERLPSYIGMTSGFRTGVLRRPLVPRFWFTTFALSNDPQDFHPFLYSTGPYIDVKGSVVYHADSVNRVEAGSVHMDEDEGRLIFIQRCSATVSQVLVVLELV